MLPYNQLWLNLNKVGMNQTGQSYASRIPDPNVLVRNQINGQLFYL